MSSNRRVEDVLLELDLPTTVEDVEALRRARAAVPCSLPEALARLSSLRHLSPAPAKRETSAGWVAFSLE